MNRCCLLIVLLLSSTSFYAQFASNDSLLMEGKPNIDQCSFTDLDQDGDQDLITMNEDLRNLYVYYNEFGSFTTKDTLLSTSQGPVEFYLEDYDYDGDLDICVIDYTTSARFYANDGNQHFVQVAQIINSSGNGVSGSSLCFSDLDGDGIKDILLSSSYTLRYKNLGNFNFVYQQTSAHQGAVTTADVNNDGAQDVLVCFSNLLYVNLNNGAGNLPLSNVVTYGTSSGGSDCTQMVVYDFDADGDVDIIILNSSTKKIYVRKNNGSGVFSTVVTLYSYSSASIRIFNLLKRDLNGDGIPDLVFRQTGPTSSTRNVCCLIGNQGSFQPIQTLYTYEVNYNANDAAMDFANTNSNVLPEMVVVPFQYSKVEDLDICSSDTTSTIAYTFSVHVERFGKYLGDIVRFADLDNDSDLDFWTSSIIFQNSGNLLINPIIDPFDVEYTNYKLADMNEDGFVDLIGLRSNLYIRYNSGNGNGMFGSEIMLHQYVNGNDLEIIDINNDGHLDIVYSFSESSSDPKLKVKFNLGGGLFNMPSTYLDLSNLSLFTYDFIEIKVNDVATQPYQLSDVEITNNGQKIYARVDINSSLICDNPTSYMHCLQIYDLDQDGFTDVLYTDNDGIYWQRNLTNGSFSTRIHLETIGGYNEMILEDFDNDNDKDIVYLFNETVYWKENIDGIFSSSLTVGQTSLPNGSHYLYGADITGDGFRDIIYTNNNTPSKMYTFVNTLVPTTVSGIVFNDLDQDQIHDFDEPVLPNISITITPGNLTCVTDNMGQYSFHPSYGSYTISALGGNNWSPTTATTCSTAISGSNPIANTCNFGFVATTNVSSALINLTSSYPICGQQSLYQITATNTGTLPLNGLIKLDLPVPQTFLTSSQTPDSIVGETYYWHFDSITSSETYGIGISVGIPSVAGTILDASVNLIYTPVNGGISQDLVDSLTQIVGCNLPSVNKLVEPTGVQTQHYIPDSQEWLEYSILFTNDGADTISSVIVTDEISTYLDLSSIVVTGFSHPYSLTIEPGNKLKFTFQQINLPPFALNISGSQGFITFRANIVSGLAHNTAITNQAEIKFDNQLTKLTPSTLSTIFQCTDSLLYFNVSSTHLCAGGGINVSAFAYGNDNGTWYVDGQFASNSFGSYIGFNDLGPHELSFVSTHPVCPNTDSTIIITAHGTFTQLIPDTIVTCAGEGVMIHGQLQYQEGLYYSQLSSPYGCDSIVQTYLRTLPVSENIIDSITVCDGDATMIWGVLQSSEGIYYDVYQGANGCDSLIGIKLIVLPLPNISLGNFETNPLCIENGPIALPTVSPLGGIFTGSGVSNNQFDPNIAGLGSHSVTYSYTAQNGCSNSLSESISVVDCLGLSEYEDNDWIVYPNPSNGHVTVAFDSEPAELYNLVVHNAYGQIVISIDNLQEISQQIDLSEAATGVYFLEIHLENKAVQLARIVIE